MTRDDDNKSTIPGHRTQRLEMLVALLDKEGVAARVTGPSLNKLVVPIEIRDEDGIRLSPIDHPTAHRSIPDGIEKQTEMLLVGIGLLAGFSLAQLFFHWL